VAEQEVVNKEPACDRPSIGTAIFFCVVALLLAGPVLYLLAWPEFYGWYRDWRYEDDVRAAMAEVEAACTDGNRFMYMDRRVKFKTELSKVSGAKGLELQAALNNRLIMLMCEPSPAAQQQEIQNIIRPKARRR